MFVGEVMSKCVTECTEDASLTEVYDLIRKCEHGIVVVIDSLAHRVPIGIVSERSILDQIIERGRNPKSLFAGSVMDSHIKTVSESDLVESISVADDVTAIVITDRSRQVCGLMTPAELRRIQPTINVEVKPLEEKPTRRASGIREIPAFGWIQ